MPSERITLHTRDRRVVEGTAAITRYGPGMRLLRGGGIALAGAALGSVTIVLPGLHFVLPWAIPLAALGIGVYVARETVVIGLVEAACPDCGAAIEAPGGSASEDVWIRCPSCTLPLRVEITS